MQARLAARAASGDSLQDKTGGMLPLRVGAKVLEASGNLAFRRS